jgi:signal transduction histidine kinase/ActR/RegA family two-component response regulator
MRFRELPLDRKLIAAMIATSGAALILAATAFIAYEALDYRQSAIRQARVLGSVTAANSAGALAFGDILDASETLDALRAEQEVSAAALYGADDALFATYPLDVARSELPAKPGLLGPDFGLRKLEYFIPVQQGGVRLGTLFLRVDMDRLYSTLILFAVITAIMLGAALTAAFIVARRLQEQISTPLIALGDTARAVAERHDYSVRAERPEQRELQVLTDAFNQMLTRIDETQTRLESQLGRMDLLQRTTRAIGERQDLPSILQVVVGRLESEMPVDLACVARHLPAERKLAIECVGARTTAIAQDVGVFPGEEVALADDGLMRAVSGAVVYEPELGEVRESFVRRFTRAGLAALIACPLTIDDKVWGLLIAARCRPHSFTSADVEFLRQLSDHASLAVRQVRLTDDLRRAYEDLRESQLTVAQQERLRALGQMASGIAHDINNAISPVMLYVASLLEREPLSARGRGQLETIQRAIEDVTLTVKRMREFYRRRESPADFVPLELNALAREVIELTRPRWANDAQERGALVELREELAPQPVWVRGIGSEIRDALVNLVFNAVDAMPSGGVLTVRTAPARSGSELACIEVVDTGSGMDEATRARCLEPFFTTKGERGTGMGLAMVYGMVRRHAGQIEIDTAPGRGSTLRLLLAASPSDGESVQAPPPPLTGQRLRLLVVDDDPLLIQSLRDALELDGHEVMVADGGQSGIDAFVAARSRGAPPDAVITDLGMPHVDGRAVAAAVKAIDPRVSVILLTGWGARLVTESDVPEGVDRVLSKPPRLPDLRRALAAVAQEGRNAQEMGPGPAQPMARQGVNTA